MISIERLLTRQLFWLTSLLLILIWSLDTWWARSTLLDVQVRTLAEEAEHLHQLLRNTPDRDTAKTLALRHQQHTPGHAYLVRYDGEIWHSMFAEQFHLPAKDWFEREPNDRSHSFEYPLTDTGRTLLVNRVHFPALADLPVIEVVAIKEVTGVLDLVKNSHIKLALSSGLAVIILIGLQRAALRRAFSRIEATRREVLSLNQGESKRLSSPVIVETAPLIDAINQLMETMLNRTQRTHHAMGNLSHAMKTPIAVLQQLSARQDLALPQEVRDTIIEQACQLDRLIERELRRARILGSNFHATEFSIEQTLGNIAETMTMIHRDKSLHFDLSVHPDSRFPGDRSDFMELMGNLMDNAAKWCTSTVTIEVCVINEHLHLQIVDDGQGCDDEQLEKIIHRGIRLDESVSGHGLGLGIVNDIVLQYGGRICFERAKLGGLGVLVALPAHRREERIDCGKYYG